MTDCTTSDLRCHVSKNLSAKKTPLLIFNV